VVGLPFVMNKTYPYQGSDFCMNPFSRSRENDRDSEGDEENDAD
jgi:hypothetical protein